MRNKTYEKIIKEQTTQISLLYDINDNLENEIERLNSIIKEVREYIKKQLEVLPHYMYEAEMYKLLEILDKENI